MRLLGSLLVRIPLVDLGPGGCQRGFGKMMLAMMTTAEFADAPVRHELDVMIGGWECTVVYVHPSGCVLHNFLRRCRFLRKSVWRRAMPQPRWDRREESGRRCCAQARSRSLSRRPGHLVEKSAWKSTAPRFLPARCRWQCWRWLPKQPPRWQLQTGRREN